MRCESKQREQFYSNFPYLVFGCMLAPVTDIEDLGGEADLSVELNFSEEQPSGDIQKTVGYDIYVWVNTSIIYQNVDNN